MKTRILIILVSLLVASVLTACGPSMIELSATATKAAADIFATLTAKAPTITPTIPPTPTTTLTPIPTATETAIPTAVPTQASITITDWEKFEVPGLEIWLPESYEGGDPAIDLDLIISTLRSLGPDFESVASMIEQNPSMFALWAFDSMVGESGFLTNVNITHEQVFTGMSLDTYIDASVKQLVSYFNVTEQTKVQLDNYEAGRIIVEAEIAGVQVKEVMYIVKNGNIMWLITYATSMSEFEARFPSFEQSANSFLLVP